MSHIVYFHERYVKELRLLDIAICSIYMVCATINQIPATSEKLCTFCITSTSKKVKRKKPITNNSLTDELQTKMHNKHIPGHQAFRVHKHLSAHTKNHGINTENNKSTTMTEETVVE